ncbi:MAG: hypothetical protein PHG54_09085 [Smithellaceae bacterium]|nr:hypothetical protein [Smithellaceae bacterium]
MADNFHSFGPSVFIGPNISAIFLVLESENNLFVILFILRDAISRYDAAEERGLLLLFVKIDFPADQIPGFAFFYRPAAALPLVIGQFDKIIQRFNHVDVHVVPPKNKFFAFPRLRFFITQSPASL